MFSRKCWRVLACLLLACSTFDPSVALAEGEISASDCSYVSATARPARSTDAAVINKTLKIGDCYDPTNAVGINAEAEEAKQFLISRYEIGPRSAPCIRTKEEGIGGLKTEFAIRVARLIKDMESQLGGKNIVRSAFRPQACGGGVGHSNGCAVDIEWAHSGGWRPASDNPGVIETQWIIKNGGDPKYLIHFPFPYPPEWHHIEPKDRNGCIAGRALDPSVAGIQVGLPSGAGDSPMQRMMSGLQNFFTPPQPVICQSGFTLINGSCFPSQAIAPATDPFNYIPPTATSTASTTPDFSGNRVSDSINTDGNMKSGTSTSAIDLINAIANPETAYGTTTATGTPVALNSTLANTVGLNGTNPNGTKLQGATSTYTLAPTGGQTFTSSDLSRSAVPNSEWKNASTFALLENLKQLLISMLQLLRPFGGAVPHPFAPAHTTMEYQY